MKTNASMQYTILGMIKVITSYTGLTKCFIFFSFNYFLASYDFCGLLKTFAKQFGLGPGQTESKLFDTLISVPEISF